MPHIQGVQRDALVLFPPSLDEYITDDNPVRFIDAFVDQLELLNVNRICYLMIIPFAGSHLPLMTGVCRWVRLFPSLSSAHWSLSSAARPSC